MALANRLQFHRGYRRLPGMKTPSTDRRAYERYDVVGALWGVLEMPEVARVLNASTTGLLIEAALSPVLHSVHAVRLAIDGEPVQIDAVVRHCRVGSEGKHLIGLEFRDIPTSLLASLERLSADKQIEVIDFGTSRS